MLMEGGEGWHLQLSRGFGRVWLNSVFVACVLVSRDEIHRLRYESMRLHISQH